MPGPASERWRVLLDWPAYEVSDFGRVMFHGQILSPIHNKKLKWRKQIWLKRGKERKKEYVSRLVLIVFERPPVGKELARHLNDDATDDRLSNLAWGTHIENAMDAKRNGIRLGCERRKPLKVRTRSARKLTPRTIEEMCAIRKRDGIPYEEIGKMFGVKKATARRAILGITWKELLIER